VDPATGMGRTYLSKYDAAYMVFMFVQRRPRSRDGTALWAMGRRACVFAFNPLHVALAKRKAKEEGRKAFVPFLADVRKRMWCDGQATGGGPAYLPSGTQLPADGGGSPGRRVYY